MYKTLDRDQKQMIIQEWIFSTCTRQFNMLAWHQGKYVQQSDWHEEQTFCSGSDTLTLGSSFQSGSISEINPSTHCRSVFLAWSSDVMTLLSTWPFWIVTFWGKSSTLSSGSGHQGISWLPSWWLINAVGCTSRWEEWVVGNGAPSVDDWEMNGEFCEFCPCGETEEKWL